MERKSTTCKAFKLYSRTSGISDHLYRYDTVAQSADSSGIQAPSSWTVSAIETWLSEHAKSIMTDETDHLTLTVDLFEHGFDR